jgi:putative ATP-binding cassette transporter
MSGSIANDRAASRAPLDDADHPVDVAPDKATAEAPIIEVVDAGGHVEPPPPEVVEPDPDLTPEEAEQARKDYLLTRFWISARGFWGKSGDKLAWAFSIGLLALIVTNVGFQYGINVWNRAIFDAIEKRDSATVFHLTAVFFPLALGSVALGVTQVFARMSIQRRWRAWLTHSVVTRWLASGRYYQLNLVGGDHQNPEYRIAEDLRIATDSPVNFMAGVTSAVLSAATFITVLWTIGGALTLTLGGTTVTVPGFLVIAAILYAGIASGSITVIGRRFVQISEDKNQAEAEYRYALTRVRENGESIALLGGEEEERAGIDATFGNVLKQWTRLAGQYMRTTLVSQGSSLIAPVVPLLLCAPKFLDGTMSLGEVMQAASAFTIVQSAFGWLVDNYPSLADWNACARRIASLMMSLDGLERAELGDGLGRIKRGETTDDTMLSLHDLSVTLDDGTAVVGDTEVNIQPASGCWCPARAAPARARWCAPSRGCGHGAAAASTSIPTVGCSCYRKNPMCRPARCAARRPIRRQRTTGALRRSARRSTRSALTISRTGLRKRRRGTRRCPAAKSSASLSRGCFCTTPTSSCSTRQLRRWTPRARTR